MGCNLVDKPNWQGNILSIKVFAQMSVEGKEGDVERGHSYTTYNSRNVATSVL